MARKKKNAGVDPDVLDEAEGLDEQEPRSRSRRGAKAKPKPKPPSRVSRVRSTGRGGRGR